MNTDKTTNTDNARYKTYETYRLDDKMNRNEQYDSHPNTEIWTQTSAQRRVNKLIFNPWNKNKFHKECNIIFINNRY